MEFWGVELKGEKPVKVAPGVNQAIHLSQAALAELKKCNKPVMLYAKIGDQKLVIGVLTAENIPQLSFDLVFEKEFELSHNWKTGIVHFTGYKSLIDDEFSSSKDGEVFSDFSDEDEAFPLDDKQNGVAALTAALKAKPAGPGAAAAENDKSEDESDESDDDESDEDDSDEEMFDDDEDDSEEDESDEQEETPAKSAGGKKRPATDTKTPEVAKKAKLATPKTDGKKAGIHVDTPHPAKNAGKGGDKSNAKTPKSAGQVTCGSCMKSFNSEKALDSHLKAKHSK